MKYLLDYKPYELPFRRPVRTSHGLWRKREGILIRLHDEQNNSTRFAEIAPIPDFGTETFPQALETLQSFGNSITVEQIKNIPSSLPCLSNALRTALKPPGLSTRPSLPVSALLPSGKDALAIAERKTDEGYLSFKWKVAVLPIDDELSLLEDIFSRISDKATLRIDPNGAWDRRQAERWLERCAELPVEYIEDPARSDNLKRDCDLLLGLSSDYPTPIALDEHLASNSVDYWVNQGWQGIYTIKPSLHADIHEVLKKLSDADIVFSSALETSIGTQNALGFAFSADNKPRALGFGVYPLFENPDFNPALNKPEISTSDIMAISPEAVWEKL